MKAFDTFRYYFNQFGLGVKTGIDLPNEATGYQGSQRISGLLLDFAIGQYDTFTPAANGAVCIYNRQWRLSFEASACKRGQAT